MKAINYRLVSEAGYLINVCMMTRIDLENLDKTAKNILKNGVFYGKKTTDEQLCIKR